MSFSASARVARDAARPTGSRVRALHQCIEAFQPFGWDGTRLQLSRLCGAEGRRWSPEQLLQALDLLERTRSSWVAFAQDELREGRLHARTHRGTPRPSRGFVDWFASWLAEPGHAELWGVAGLGDCPACSHLRALHGGFACTGCLAEQGLDLGRACRLPSPLAEAPTTPPVLGRGRWSHLARWLRPAR